MSAKSQGMVSQRPNIYLLGFMGTGKSSVGRRLAAKLKLKFLDSDREIERAEGVSIKEIFDTSGEDYFRNLERKFIENGHPENGCVIACGGGLCCRDGMPELLKSKGVCIVIFSTPEEIFERVSRNNKRPLMNVPNPFEKIKELLDIRTPYYMRSGIAIASDKNMRHTVEHIERIYRSHLRRKQCK